MKTLHTALIGGIMAFVLAGCNTTDTMGTSGSSGSSSMGTTAAGSTGNSTVDAQMGITPNNGANTGPATATGAASTPTNTSHTTTSSDTKQ
jgi:predicted small secreted protein